VTDIVETIDRAIVCHTCEKDLSGSVSHLFCSEDCQRTWSASRADPLPDSVDQFADYRRRFMISPVDALDRFAQSYREIADRRRIILPPNAFTEPASRPANFGILPSGRQCREIGPRVTRGYWIARYDQFRVSCRQGFDSLDEAIGFLWWGSDHGTLHPRGVTGPSGEDVYDETAVLDAVHDYGDRTDP
jgi:hypothetical protein